MFGPTCIVLESLIKNRLNTNIRGEPKGALKVIRSFEFVFILQLMNDVMGITDILCQALQRQSQDILNALHLVRYTKILLHELRQDGWGKFFSTLVSFCERQGIDIPNMSARYKEGTCRSCQQQDHVTVDHYYHVDVFNAVIDFQLMELGTKFPEQTMELLTLSSALDPTKNFESFNIDDICSLAENYYHGDFPQKDLNTLRRQLQHYKNDVIIQAKFQNMTSLSKLCQVLSATRNSQYNFLIDRLIRLVLTLPISTASTEHAFLAMKLVKTSLSNKLANEFLENCMIVYFERELADTIDLDLVIDVLLL
ncbi:hypothetical protein Dsin_016664 [Dipteronia sinensis]|uniref:HAT C-terminal dimerisation domain-containing protein n=1 Tax=Dipteronia sinensis TaxID=43782 RepID=A0AAE0E763_9ROSI|nr:hypothetical protein Dsin_016664 [Dipteronia sinensis]